MITINRQTSISPKTYILLAGFFSAGLIMPLSLYCSEAIDDRLFCALGCIFIFCASLCTSSELSAIFVPVITMAFGLIVGKNVCASPGRLIFCIIAFPLYFLISAEALSQRSKRNRKRGFIFAAAISSLAAAGFFLC